MTTPLGRTTMMLGCALACLCVTVGAGCRSQRSGVAEVIEGPVYLYASAADCAASMRAGPNDGVIQGPEARGVVQWLEPGTQLMVIGEDIGKDSLCYRVSSASARGYVFASRRVRLSR